MKQIKSLLIIAILVVFVSSCDKKVKGYVINGIVSGNYQGWALLKKEKDNTLITADSVEVKDGKFTMKGDAAEPEMYYLLLSDKQGYAPIFLENSEIRVEMNADSISFARISGSATHEIFSQYLKEDKKLSNAVQSTYESFMAARQNDTALAARLEKELDSLDEVRNKFTLDYILKNGKSVVSAFLAYNNSYAYNFEDIDKILKSFDAATSKSGYALKLKERAAILENVQTGKIAPDFTQNDTTGKPVALSSFKGKVVLVDFWASWCRPCRAENPNVVAAYNKFKDKGFTVLGVSLDDSRQDWIDAIKKDKLTWTHVSDLKKWKNEFAAKYGVMSIPANFLIDAEGKIIASGLRGEDLFTKLEEVLNKPE